MYQQTLTTYGDYDVQILDVSGVWLADSEGVTWSMTREQAPIYTMGAINPRTFIRGRRNYSGSVSSPNLNLFKTPGPLAIVATHRTDMSYTHIMGVDVLREDPTHTYNGIYPFTAVEITINEGISHEDLYV